ncbi:pepsin/retropepsin-like aspartic protease family protein [uncultured Duncaniella sp.]|uniref:pepsin/retropepsin-like aspartic protease family protein n=1 Tax=uncultured Duncaniella sp. TaxID=2768039 RepID=UPI0025A9480F|nr:pepsin/retropepsin-like aspartic protease family protein [uncultured Duncaniella sp.]
MIIRKIICLLFAVLLVRSGIAQENPYDNAIGETISRSAWFETRACYERTADSLSDYMRLFSGALLDHNFNNPAGAVEKIQRMYVEYNDQMGGNFFSLFWMMSDNLAKLGLFKDAHEICTSLLSQGRNYMDEGTRTAFESNAVLFRLKSQWPRLGVSDTNANYDIPFDIKDEQIKFTAARGTQLIGAMLDSGGQMTIIDKQLALRLELPLSADSILFNEAQCPLALLDTLRLGHAMFVNVPCVVLSLGDTDVTDCSLIIGNDLLQLFPEIELDYESRKLHLRSRTVPLPDAPRNLMLNKVPYIRAELERIPATIVWDTGATISSIEPKFHELHRNQLPPLEAHGRKRAKTATGYSPELEYAILPQLGLTIGDKTGVMTNLYVVKDMPHSELMGIPFDGTLGVLPPTEFKHLTINFKEMYFIVK